MSVISQASQKIHEVRKDLSQFILTSVQGHFYPNSAGGLEWIPKDILERRNSYAVYNEHKTMKVVIAGFNTSGVIIEERNGQSLNYKSFNQLSLEELMLVAQWVEADFEIQVAEVAKAASFA